MLRLRRKHDEDHEEIEKTLDEHEKLLEEHAKRLRVLEIELGVYNPKVDEIIGDK